MNNENKCDTCIHAANDGGDWPCNLCKWQDPDDRKGKADYYRYEEPKQIGTGTFEDPIQE